MQYNSCLHSWFNLLITTWENNIPVSSILIDLSFPRPKLPLSWSFISAIFIFSQAHAQETSGDWNIWVEEVEDKDKDKAKDSQRPGDWQCQGQGCQFLNFAKED